GAEVEVAVVERERLAAVAGVDVVTDDFALVPLFGRERPPVHTVDGEVVGTRLAELLEAAVATGQDERLGVELEREVGRERPVQAEAEGELLLPEVGEEVAATERGGGRVGPAAEV